MSTLGLASYTKRSSPWYGPEGQAEFLRLLRIYVSRVSPPDAHLETQVSWDAVGPDVRAKLASLHFDPSALLRPTPPAILEAIHTLADVLLQRHLMRQRLGAMREQTTVALAPRAARDDDARDRELQAPPLPANSKYARYLARIPPGRQPMPLEASASCFDR